MAGNDLTIVLFLAGLAVTLAVAAMSQAGWASRTVIASLVALAVLCLIASLAWPWAKDWTPMVGGHVKEIATSPISWFTVIILGLSAFFWTNGRRVAEPNKDEIGGGKRPIVPPATQVPPPIGGLVIVEPRSEFVHLNDVAKLVYGNLGKCFLRDLIDRRSTESSDRLNVVGGIIANYSDIYGFRLPSNVLDKIDHDELREPKVDGGAMLAKAAGAKEPRIIYDSLCVKREDITRVSDAITNVRHNSTLQIR